MKEILDKFPELNKRVVIQAATKQEAQKVVDFLESNGYVYVVQRSAWEEFDISVLEKK